MHAYHCAFYFLIAVICFYTMLAISQEKTIKNIEGFDKCHLKHAETEEKNQLPSSDGRYQVKLHLTAAVRMCS